MTASTNLGISITPPHYSPWDAPGRIWDTWGSLFQVWEFLVTPRFFLRHSHLYNANSTDTSMVFLPPMPCNINANWRTNDASKFSSAGYAYPSGSSYTTVSVSLSSSETWVGSNAYKWFTPYYQPTSCAGWSTTTPAAVIMYAKERSIVQSGSGQQLRCGTPTTAVITPDNLNPAIHNLCGTGLDRGTYNNWIRQIDKATWTPVLHCWYGKSTYWSTDLETELQSLRFPVCFSPLAPIAQKTFSFVFFNRSSEVIPSYIDVFYGQRSMRINKLWSSGSYTEYQADLTPLLGGQTPDVAGSYETGRNIYHLEIRYAAKGVYIRSMAIWSGVHS